MAVKNLLVDLNLNQNEIQNFVVQNLTTAPANPVVGQEYFNTVTTQKLIYTEAGWVDETNQGEVYTFTDGVQVDENNEVTLLLDSSATALSINASHALTIATASTTQAGVIEIATDAEAEAGTSEVLAVNPKQLAAAVADKIELTDLSVASASNAALTYDNTVGEFSLAVDSAVTEDSTNPVESGAVFDELAGKVDANTAITGATKCKITYDSKGLVTAGADLEASDIPSLTLAKISDVTASATEVNVLDGITASTAELNIMDGVTVTASDINSIPDKIELTNLSIASTSANYLAYDNTTGEFSANVDTTVTASSTNLVTSGAVESAIAAAVVGGVQYKGTWDITGATDFSGITLPVKQGFLYYVVGTGPVTVGSIEWNAGDYLLVNEDVAAGGSLVGKVEKIDNTESADIVRLAAVQTLTNKTIDADDNTVLDLELDNFKSGVVVDSTTGIAIVSSASDDKVATEKAIATALEAKTNKFTAMNPALTPSAGVATWTITNTLADADVAVTIKEVSTGDEVIANVRQSANNIVITFNASAAVSAETYKAVVIG